MKSFFIETYGCQMNKADSNSIKKNLIENDFIEVESPENAEIIIINTCSVRKSAENRIWGRLGFYKSIKKRKKITVVIVGCMAQRIKEDFFELDDTVDIVIGTYQKDIINEILKNHQRDKKLTFVNEKEIKFTESSPDENNPRKAFVVISHGCNNYCSYCIVPYVRGREISRSSKEIIDDINNLTRKGVIQVTLLGQNVNSYGKDNNDVSFPQLLKLIAKETDIKWIKYLSSHPKDLSDELIQTIQEENKVANYLHLPLQSGSNKILQAMNRKYTIESYLDKVDKIKKLIPNINLTTDIIVGFPNETERDFLDTVNVLKSVRFDDAYMYKYNIREGTVAQKNITDDIPEEIKGARLSQIIEIQRDITRQKKEKRVSQTFETIVENWSKKADSEILGLTKEDLMIIYKGDEKDFSKINKVKAIKLEGNTLYGEKI